MTLVALIPARGGSKGIPNKNLKEFKGKPLIQWTIEQAHKSEFIDRVIVSTDNNEIANISRKLDAEVPFIRPDYLATDTSSILETVIYTLDKLEEINDLILLQPTSPLRRVADINNIVRLRSDNNRSSAVSVKEISEYPEWMIRIKNNYLSNYFSDIKSTKRRQDLEKIYILNGSLYLTTRRHLYTNQSFISDETIPYIMKKEFSIDIDDESDWNYAEYIYDKFINIK